MAKQYPTVEEKRAHITARMERAVAAIGKDARFQPNPNNTAAGPCEGCIRISKRSYKAKDAPLMPLDECPHPDQCVGIYSLKI